MKIIRIVLLVLFLTASISAIADAVTCDGDIQIMDTRNWQVLGSKSVPYVAMVDGQITIFPAMSMTLKNPIKSPINTVTLIFVGRNNLIAYWYMKDGKRYDFEYDPKQDKFVQQ